MTAKMRKLPETESPATAEPEADAIAAYRELVFSAVETGVTESDSDIPILAAAGQTVKDFKADCETFRQRLAAARVLASEIPQREAELASMQAAAAHVGDIAYEKVDGHTIEEIYGLIRKYEEYLASLPDLATPRPTTKTCEQRAVIEMQSALSQTRGRAEVVLASTAYLDPELLRLQSEASNLQRAIAARCPRDLAAMVSAQRDVVSQLVQKPMADSRKEWRQQLADAKAELSRLEKLAATSPGDEDQAQQRLDEQRLGEMREQIVALESKRLEPRNLKWQ